MVTEQQREFMNNLKQTILRLCHDGVPHFGKIEIDGLICIHIEDDQQDMIVKVHESLFKPSPFSDVDISQGPPPSRSPWRPSLLYPSQSLTPMQSLNSGPHLRDLLNQSQKSQRALYSPSANSEQSDSNNAICYEDGPPEDGPDGDDAKQIVQAPLYKQLWDKYKTSGSGGSLKRGAKVAQLHDELGDGVSVAFVCKICRVSLNGCDHLEKHYSSMHNVHMCRQCFRTFSMLSNLRRHMRMHTGQKPYKCTICGKSFTRKDDLSNHILKHKESKPFTCGQCKKGYTERSSIRGHLRREHNANADDIHICTQCGIAFSALNSFVAHLKTHSKIPSDGRHAYVQEHSSINPSDLSMELDENSEEMDEQASPSNISCQTPDVSSRDHEDNASSPINMSHVDNTNKHLLDVIVSRPDGSPCSVSVKVGNFLGSNQRTAECSPHSIVSAAPFVQDQISDTSDHYECMVCNANFSSFAELSHHSVKQHEKHSCVHCGLSNIDTVEELNDHVHQCHHGDNRHGDNSHGDKQDTKELRGIDSAGVKGDANVGATHPDENQILSKIKIEKTDFDEEQDSPASNQGSPGSGPLFLSQPVFPGSPLQFKPEINLATSSASSPSDFAMSKSSDSHSFGRIIEIKDVFPTNGSGLKKPSFRAGGTKLVHRDEQGELMCPLTYQCTSCKEVFTETDEFLNHSLDVHQRYGCKYCGQTFSQCGNRNRHLRYHSGDRPYVCPECGDTFARQDALKNHVDARHKKTSCPICGVVFPKQHLASLHLKNEHGVCNI